MEEPRAGLVDCEGVRLRTWEWSGAGQPALLVHATGFHGRLWDPIACRLAPARRVIAIDQRGHGDSDKPEMDYHWRWFARDVACVVRALGLSGAVGIGHSGGAAAIARAELEGPGTFGALVLIEPIIYPPAPRRAPGIDALAAAARRRRMTWESRNQMLASWSGRPPFASWRREVLEAYVTHGARDRPGGAVELKCPGEYEARMFEQSGSLDSFQRLEGLRPPVLLLFGQQSATFTPAQRAVLAARIPRCAVREIPGATHFAPMEEPGRLAEEILAFLGPPPSE